MDGGRHPDRSRCRWQAGSPGFRCKTVRLASTITASAPLHDFFHSSYVWDAPRSSTSRPPPCGSEVWGARPLPPVKDCSQTAVDAAGQALPGAVQVARREAVASASPIVIFCNQCRRSRGRRASAQRQKRTLSSGGCAIRQHDLVRILRVVGTGAPFGLDLRRRGDAHESPAACGDKRRKATCTWRGRAHARPSPLPLPPLLPAPIRYRAATLI